VAFLRSPDVVQPKKKKAEAFLRWLFLPVIPVLWCVASHFGLLDYFENRSIDWRFHYRGEIDAPVKIVYVDIDSRSIDDIGNWPWSRSYFAKVTQALLNRGGVAGIGFDIVLVPSASAEIADRTRMKAGDAELGRLIYKPLAAKPPPVVFAASFASGEFRARDKEVVKRGLPRVASDPRRPNQIEPPEASALEAPNGAWITPPFVGLIDTIDGGTRQVPIWAPTRTGDFYHMAVALARFHFQVPLAGMQRHDDRLELTFTDGEVAASIPLRDRQLVEVNWFSAWSSPKNPRISLSQVYAYARMLESDKPEEQKTGEEFFAQEEWKGAIVLVGPVDPLMQDLAPTPFDEVPVPKVGVHGNLLKTIVSGLYLERLPPWATYATIIALTLLISAFAAAGGAGGARSKLTAALLLTAYGWLALHLFATQHLILPLVAPIGAIFTTTFAAIGWQLIAEEKQKRRIQGIFGAYVSPQLVERMVDSGEDPKLGGHETEITAYFSDIQGFSSFSEKLPPSKLVELMNEYLTACTNIVTAQSGTLDKYIGDAVVAMFGAPIPLTDHAYRACVATQLVHLKLAELREKWKSEGDKWPEIVWKMQSRIGLNTGVATIGNMGSATRFNYTMMGDNVNLAARMESGAKSWGTYTMVSEATKKACEAHGDRVVFRPLGRIVVMGRSNAVPIHEIVGLTDALAPAARECIGLFSAGLDKYYARDWDAALALFRQSAELEPNQPGKTPGVKSNPSLVYLGIAEKYKLQPPAEDWDGVYTMNEK
jgi:adenylate cyclase